MTRIFISTNSNQPPNCFRTDADQLAVLDYLRNQNFPTESVKQVSDNVYLVFDTLDELPDTLQINRNEDCLLYHSTTTETVKRSFDAIRIKEGHQTQNEEHLYLPVFRILIDNEANKFNRILKELGFTQEQIEQKNTLESQLNFLHHCLTPDGLSKAELKQEWDAENEFKVLKGVEEDSPFGDSYLTSLRTLRDALLRPY